MQRNQSAGKSAGRGVVFAAALLATAWVAASAQSALAAGQPGLIAYEAVQADGNQSILAQRLNDSSIGALTSGSQIDADPTFSPDGQRIAFRSDRDGDEEIYLANWDGSGVTQLTFNDTFDGEPTWSPDGTEIAYRSGPDGDASILVRNLNDGSTRSIVAGPGTNRSPAWSPTGDQIAFVSDRSGQDDIYTVTTDGKLVKNLTDTEGADLDPAWSPDGKQIAFASNRTGGLNLYTMRFNGKAQEDQTQSDATETEPAWSPDGARIAFTGSSGDGETDIYALNISGDLGIEPIETRAGQESNPAWQPLDYNLPSSRITSPRLGRRAGKRAGRSRTRNLSIKLRRVSGRVDKAGAAPVTRVEVAVRLASRGRCYELNPASKGAAVKRCGSGMRFFVAKGTSRFQLEIPKRQRKAVSALAERATGRSSKSRKAGLRCEIFTRAVDAAGNAETRFKKGRNRVRARCR